MRESNRVEKPAEGVRPAVVSITEAKSQHQRRDPNIGLRAKVAAGIPDMNDADLHRLIESARDSRLARALYECRAWLGASSPSSATLAHSDGASEAGSINEHIAEGIETAPPVARPQ